MVFSDTVDLSTLVRLGTLDSSLKVLVGPRLGMAQMPLDTTVNKIAVSRNETVQGTQFDFSVKNLHPIVREPFSVPFRDQATTVIFTPTELAFSVRCSPSIQKWDDVARMYFRAEQHGKEREGSQEQDEGPDQQTSRTREKRRKRFTSISNRTSLRAISSACAWAGLPMKS